MNRLNETPALDHIFNVAELMNYDMIYIYHHLHEGASILLKKDNLQLGDQQNYHVYFKGFKIGSIFISSLFLALYGEQDEIEARVANITKEKYLPVKALDIVVGQPALKLVS